MHSSPECMYPHRLYEFQLTIRRKEDLGMYGNELNYMQACWTVGYVIGEIPSNMLLTKIRPRYWLPAMEVVLPTHFHVQVLMYAASMDGPYVQLIKMQHIHPVLRPKILHRYVPRLIIQTPLTQSRSRREHILPRNAIHHRLMVQKRRASEAFLYLPHEQRYRKYVLWVPHGRGV